MSSGDAYAPKHRGAPAAPAVKRKLKRSVVVSGIAVATTGVAVSAGLAMAAQKPDSPAATLSAAKTAVEEPIVVDRSTTAVSRSAARSQSRAATARAKRQALSQASGGQVTVTASFDTGDPRDIARAMLAEFGWSQSQFGCLDSLFTRESGWRTTAANPSGAYGIPQALPGSKMATAGADWRDNPETQIRWGLGYIAARYGNPCGAWGHSQSSGWY